MRLFPKCITVAYVTAVIVMFLSCTSSVKMDDAEVNVDGGLTAELTDLPIDVVDTVELSCPDSVVLGSLNQVYVCDNMLIVLDSTPMAYGFTSTGEYVCSYGSRGDAPMEFVNLGACAISPDQKVVICDSFTQRMLFYDLHTGQFVKEIKFPDGALDMVQQCVFISDSTTILVRYVFNNNNYVYAVANLNDPSVSDFGSVPVQTKNVAMPIGGHSISAFQGKACYIKPFSPFIYQYPDNRWISIEQPKPVFDLTEEPVANYSILTYVKAIQDDLYAGYTDIYELRDWIFLGLFDLQFALIDKHGWKMTCYSYEKDDMMNFNVIAKIIGMNPEANILIGSDNYSMGENDRIILYRLK